MSISEIMRFETKLLLTFYVVAEELHFGKAAKRLHMTVPPLSRRIQKLEDLVGAPLLIRSTRAVALTPVGSLMYRELQKLLGDISQMLSLIQDTIHNKQRSFSVGLTPGVAHSPLVEALHNCRRMHPDIDLILKELNSVDMADALKENIIEIGLFRPSINRDDIKIISVYKEQMCVVSRYDHLSITQTISIEQLTQYPLITYNDKRSPYLRSIVDSLFSTVEHKPHFIQESELPTILTLVEAGIGLALVPQSIAQSHPRTLKLATLENPNLLVVETVLGVLRSNSNPIARDFSNLILEHFKPSESRFST